MPALLTPRGEQPTEGVAGLVQRHPFAGFVALAYAVSWTLWAISYAGGGDVAFLAGVLGPGIAAYVVLRATGGSLRAWAASCVRWRIPLRWWAYALGLPVVLYAAVSLTLQLLGRPVDWGLAIDRAPAYGATWLFVLVLGGGLEEPGWRGFGLPHLLETHTPVRATLIIGLVWGVWHVPIYGPLGFLVPMVLAFFYTFLWARTGSVLLAIVLHASFTPAQDHLILLPRDEAYSTALDAPDLAILGVYLTAVAALLVLTRGRLGVPGGPTGGLITPRAGHPHDGGDTALMTNDPAGHSPTEAVSETRAPRAWAPARVGSHRRSDLHVPPHHRPPHEELSRPRRCGRPDVRRPTWQGHRVPRPQRCREVNHHEGPARPGVCRQWNRLHR